MKKWNFYDIPFVGLKVGTHEFNYTIDSDFYQFFEDSIIQESNIQLRLLFEKKSEFFFALNFEIEGTVNTECDRCLSNFDLVIFSENLLLVKAEGDEIDSEDSDIVFIPRSNIVLNIAQYIYEYINLSIPIRKVHPDDEEGEPTCSEDMLEHLDNLLIDDEEESPDPRWDALKGLRDKFNN